MKSIINKIGKSMNNFRFYGDVALTRDWKRIGLFVALLTLVLFVIVIAN